MASKFNRFIGIIFPDQSIVMVNMVAFPTSKMFKTSAFFGGTTIPMRFTTEMPFAYIMRSIVFAVRCQGWCVWGQ